MASSLRPATIIAATVGTLVTGFVAYAIYFDFKRQTDPEFRKALKREARRDARVARSHAEAQSSQQKEAIRKAIATAKEDGFPVDVEDKEAFFMSEVARGETLCQDGSDQIEAALCFYKALKVYPQPSDLISIYDKTVPKPVLDILAEMIASDSSISVGKFADGSPGGSLHGIDN